MVDVESMDDLLHLPRYGALLRSAIHNLLLMLRAVGAYFYFGSLWFGWVAIWGWGGGGCGFRFGDEGGGDCGLQFGGGAMEVVGSNSGQEYPELQNSSADNDPVHVKCSEKKILLWISKGSDEGRKLSGKALILEEKASVPPTNKAPSLGMMKKLAGGMDHCIILMLHLQNGD